MKAFLSHSSEDKEFVRAVALELGRQYCIFDEQAFETGEEFREAIDKGLDSSTVFVLFATKKALKKIWIKHEIDEAWYRKHQQALSKALVYIIDGALTYKDIPAWLRRGLVRSENVSKIVAEDIKKTLDDLIREKRQQFFLGRSSENAELEKVLTPLDSSPPPHIIYISGLQGIGRRAFIRNSTPTLLNLKKFVEIQISDGDTINDLCIRVADHSEPFSTMEGFKRIAADIRGLSNEDALKRVLYNIRNIVRSGSLPIFIDDGGLLNEEGYIQQSVAEVINSIAPNDEAYVFIISSRRPRLTPQVKLPVISLKRLKTDDTRRLISLLSSNAKIPLEHSELTEIASYVAGYPPAAYFAIEQIKHYGVESVILDKTRLVEFRTNVFFKHFSSSAIRDKDKDILRLLASFSPLPLRVVSKVLAIDTSELVENVVRLIDLSLVVLDEDGYYRIAEPVADAAIKALGLPSTDIHKDLANTLVEFMGNKDLKPPLLNLSSVLFRAAIFAKNEDIAKQTVHLVSDLMRLTRTHYHNRDYKLAIKFGKLALSEQPENINTRSFLARAYIKEEDWANAEDQIKELSKYAPKRYIYYLRGFLKRKQYDLPAAMTFYKKAEELGNKSIPLMRELAFCHLKQGNTPTALKCIKAAGAQKSDNPYLVDLWANIAMHNNDDDEIRQALARLEVVDEVYYNFRFSRYQYSLGDGSKALDAAQKAYNSSSNPPFEIIGQLIYCEIESGSKDTAKSLLDSLDRDYKTHHDIRVALRCKLALSQYDARLAIDLSDTMRDKDVIYYKKIRHDAIEVLLRTSVIDDSDRGSYEEELATLTIDLSGISAEQFIPGS